jgi:nicotinate-nucleotide adenylyltransferase
VANQEMPVTEELLPTWVNSRRLAIMGGTFDPIHYGHLLVAEEARERFELDCVVFIPNGSPPHKKNYKVASQKDRYAMCELAIAPNEAFGISRVEIDRPGYSYAIDTIAWFRTQCPNLEALYFITGADAVVEITTWRRFEDLTQQCEFIAATRPGTDMNRLRVALDPPMLSHIHFMEIPGLDISSSSLRERIRTGRTVRYQTPDSVVGYIEVHGLYK